MKLDELLCEIEKDSVIDQANLDSEALKIPLLHAKYYRIFLEETRVFRGMDTAFASLKKSRIDYYLGRASDEVYANEPLHVKVLKTEIDMYLAADTKLAEMAARKEMQRSKCEAIEAFIKTINNRSFLIQSAIQWRRFQAGLS